VSERQRGQRALQWWDASRAAVSSDDIIYQGHERDMVNPQGAGSCNLCHSDVVCGAPDRLILR
jgi:hypothetical protein